VAKPPEIPTIRFGPEGAEERIVTSRRSRMSSDIGLPPGARSSTAHVLL